MAKPNTGFLNEELGFVPQPNLQYLPSLIEINKELGFVPEPNLQYLPLLIKIIIVESAKIST